MRFHICESRSCADAEAGVNADGVWVDALCASRKRSFLQVHNVAAAACPGISRALQIGNEMENKTQWQNHGCKGRRINTRC